MSTTAISFTTESDVRSALDALPDSVAKLNHCYSPGDRGTVYVVVFPGAGGLGNSQAMTLAQLRAFTMGAHDYAVGRTDRTLIQTIRSHRKMNRVERGAYQQGQQAAAQA